MNEKYSSNNTPPGPNGNRLTGNLAEFQANPLRFLTNLANRYGDISQFRLGPFQKFYLVNDPNLIKEILVTKEKSFVKSRDIQTLKTIVGEGLLTSEKEHHMRQRRLIQPSFKRSHINSYAQDMIDTTNRYIAKWKDGEERSLSDDMMNITLGIISKTMFSMDFEEGSTIIGDPMESIMKQGIKRMRSLLQLPLWIPTKNNRELKAAVGTIDNILYDIINKRRESSDKQDDLLGVLMNARDEDDGSGMSNNQLRDELMTIFLAGHETTANALTWTFYLLSQHPEVETKLHNEIDKVIGEGDMTPEHFSSLNYCQNIIWESFRLYPPAYVIGRQVDKEVVIGGYKLKKGEMVFMSQYVMHRNPKYFDHPSSFIPERFENDMVKTLPTYAYFPFGGGPRVCIGNHFALMEATLALVCIARKYSLKLAPDHHPIIPQPVITLRPKRGIRVTIKEK